MLNNLIIFGGLFTLLWCLVGFIHCVEKGDDHDKPAY